LPLVARRQRPAVDHQLDLALAADHTCQRALVHRLEPPLGTAFADDAPGLHRLCEALEHHAAEIGAVE
jgi:hypothetical protein